MKVYRVKLVSIRKSLKVLGDACVADQASGVLRISQRRRHPDKNSWIDEAILTAAHGKWEWARLVDERDD